MTIHSERSRILQVSIELLIPKSSKVAIAMLLIMTFEGQIYADNTSLKKPAPTPSPPPKPPPSQTSSLGHSQPTQSIRPPPVFNVQPANNPFSLKSLFSFPIFSPKVNNNTAGSTPAMSHPPVWTPSSYPPPSPVSTPKSVKASANSSPTTYPATTSFKAPIVFAPPANNSLANTTQATIGIPTSKQNNYPTLLPPVIPHFPTSPPQNSQAATENSYSSYATDEAPAGPIVPAYTATATYPTLAAPVKPNVQQTQFTSSYTQPAMSVRSLPAPPPNGNTAHTTPRTLGSSAPNQNAGTAQTPSIPMFKTPAYADSAYPGVRTIYPLSPVPIRQTIGNGQCTDYAAARFAEAAGAPKGFTGDAAKWYVLAQKTWQTVGPDYPYPPPGSVAVYDDSVTVNNKSVWNGLGHVAVVEADGKNNISFSEQNWTLNVVTTSTLTKDQYENRGGATWTLMSQKADPEISKAQAALFDSEGIQHHYTLQGFIIPVKINQD
jgi:surface antigen